MASVWAGTETPGIDWPIIEGWLKKAQARADEPTPILDDGQILIVARKFVGLNPVAVGAATWGMADRDNAELILGGGAMEAALPIFKLAQEISKTAGARFLLAQGRKGWARVAPIPVEYVENGRAYYRMELT